MKNWLKNIMSYIIIVLLLCILLALSDYINKNTKKSTLDIYVIESLASDSDIVEHYKWEGEKQ